MANKRGNGRVKATDTKVPTWQSSPYDDFMSEMDKVSWVHPYLAISSHTGASTVADAIIINVAEELHTASDVKLPLLPEKGQDATMIRLDMLGEIIADHINNGEKVVVHCMAGIERSALTVAWFLKNHLMFNTLDKAYGHVKKIRPIVKRRDWWVEGDIPEGAPLMAVTKLASLNRPKLDREVI